MMSLHFLCCTLLVFSTVILVENRSYNTGLIFYDPDTKHIFLPPTVSVSRGRALAHFKYSAKGSIWSTFGKPCDCSGPLCGCCVGIKVKQYNFDQKMCANVSYIKPKDEVNFEVYLNEAQSGKYGISARNPSPFCIPIMMPIPMSMCVQMSNVGLQGNNLNMCMDFVMLLDSTQLFEMHFQCMKVGAQGAQWVGPSGAPVIPPGESKIKSDSNEDSKEYYDEAEDVEQQEIEQNEEEANNNEEQQAENEEEKQEEDFNDIIDEKNKYVTRDKEEENEISSIDAENLLDVEEIENNAKEVLDNDHNDKDLLIDETIESEGEETKENEVNSSDEERVKVLNNEMPKEKIIQFPGNFTIMKYPIISISPVNVHSMHEKETAVLENRNESASGQLIIDALDDMVQKELNETAIIGNSKPLLATIPITSLALDDVGLVDNVDNAATIATFMSTTIAAATTEAAVAAEAIVPEALPLLLTPGVTATVAAASSVNDEESNNSDNSQDNDSDYEDEESEENDAKEEVQSNEDEEEEENKKVVTKSEGLKETLENDGDNVTANDTNIKGSNEIESDEKGHDINDEDEDDNKVDSEDEDDKEENEDEDETEEDSDEIVTEATFVVANTSFAGETAANLLPSIISLTSSSTTSDVIKETELEKKLEEITTTHFQLTTDTTTNISVDSDNVETNISDNSDTQISTNNLTSNFITHLVANDSTPVKSTTDAGDSKDQLQLSQITATVTPKTHPRNLLAIQRQRLRHPEQRQRQQKQQQQQDKKWQYTPHHHYQVQHQKQHRHLNQNHLQYQQNASRQHRRFYYGA